jgi:hypothetical protein
MMINDHDVNAGRVRLPLPPGVFHPDWAVDMDVYVRFMRQIRGAAMTKPEQKILVAITGVATQMAQELSIEDVASRLVGLGLRAPRGAFPAGFIDQVLAAHMRHMRRGEMFAPHLSELLTLWGVPTMGMSRPQAQTPRTPAPFRIASIPATLRTLQNSFGLYPETAL